MTIFDARGKGAAALPERSYTARDWTFRRLRRLVPSLFYAELGRHRVPAEMHPYGTRAIWRDDHDRIGELWVSWYRGADRDDTIAPMLLRVHLDAPADVPRTVQRRLGFLPGVHDPTGIEYTFDLTATDDEVMTFARG